MNTPERRIVSYFDHEFVPLTHEKLDADLNEMVDAGFTNVVLCVSEADIATKQRQEQLKVIRREMAHRGLEVWADPWGVGRVFGGEALSAFAENELSCSCNPNLDILLTTWLEQVKQAGFNTVMWDEPQLRHEPHENDELEFIERYTQRAGELGMQSVVVQCANEKKLDEQIKQLRYVAQLPNVIEIGTDPYYPNAFVPPSALPEAARLDYIERWVNYTKQAAEAAGKKWHVWVQCFDIPRGREQMVAEHLAVCHKNLADVAIWGFHGCESVPDFVKPCDADPRELWRIATTS